MKLRLKQERRFSTLDAADLEISNKQKEAVTVSSEKALSISLPEQKAVQPPAAIAADPLPDPPRTPEIRFCDVPFVDIAPGTFIMGSQEHEPGRGNDETPHEVSLSRGYSLQATPVTHGQWQVVMGSNPSCFPTGGAKLPGRRGKLEPMPGIYKAGQ